MILNRFKRAKLLRDEAERIESAAWPLLEGDRIEKAIRRVMPDFETRELTRAWQNKELARTERVVLCEFAALLCLENAQVRVEEPKT